MTTTDMDIIDRLKRCGTATLATILNKRGLNRVFMYGVTPLPGSRPRMVGRAFTMRSVPVREDKLAEDKALNPRVNLQRRATEECGFGEVLVIDCRGDATGASGGMMLFERMRLRGCAGVVSDGGVRDAWEIADSGFPVYAKAVCPPNSMVAHRFCELNVAIGCGGVAVYPGDFIVGDPDGVIVVPQEIADEVSRQSLEYEEQEEFILRKIRGGAAIYGTYPLEGEGLAEYEAERAARSKS
ncbi:ribonuclease activity regulator RraA [Shinella sp.]|uniref:RraA family protein n=1 Tax=Shinella sp. TaxID=1870904 RepID=UPI0029A0AF9E|nr:ribonuclease activity regulator RraA [Shinella sp.]MDX3974759.1 ribonuclease activity regulator RraA [Shinella sp.]